MIGLLGNLSQDMLPGRPPHVGGGPYHGARALHRLRVPARIIARCATADRDRLLPPVVRLGTPVPYVPGSSTAEFRFSYDGDRRTMTVDALGDTWRPTDVPELRCRWIHVAPLSRSEWPVATVKALARRYRVSFDGQGLVRAPQTGPLELDADFDRELLRHIWVLKLADEEAEVVGDVSGSASARSSSRTAREARPCTAAASPEHVKAHPLDRDPTGAGDAFATAYIVGRNAGFSPVGAARRATAVVASLLR